jgi:HEAT repeat protein
MPLFGSPNVEKMKAKRDVKSLIKALGYKNYAVIREEAAKALGEIGDTRAVEPLAAALTDRFEDVRKNAAEALDKFGWQPGHDQSAANYWVIKRNWAKCIEMGALCVNPLIEALWNLDSSVQRGAVEALGKIGDPRAVQNLAGLFTSRYAVRDDRLYLLAVEALGRIGSPSVVEPITVRLVDANKEVRQAAGRVLVAMYHSQALDPQTKQRILAARPKIIDPGQHLDVIPSCGGHEDGHIDTLGVGVDFPL